MFLVSTAPALCLWLEVRKGEGSGVRAEVLLYGYSF